MKESETEVSSTVSFWVSQIDAYNKKAAKWYKKADKITKRYMDERDMDPNATKYNILWSNIQTLLPALYDKAPNPNVERRFQDDDQLGLVSSQILERSVSYFVKSDDFDDCMKQSVLDRLLAGRGTAWVRYVPNIQTVESNPLHEEKENASQLTDDINGEGEEQLNQELYGEDVVVDYVHRKDFGHTVAKTWQEVRAVWRCVYMDREALKDRFKDGATISLNAKAEGGDEPTRAEVYEIWDKKERKAIWIHRDTPQPLDERDDPLKLKNFFPCPKPIYATLSNDSLIPTPDYVQYQDQAKELDNLTFRISLITEALKIAGVYDASAQGLQSLLTSSNENKLIPVDNFSVMGQNGGLKGVVSFLPIQEIASVLISLYEAREKVKADLYEITGMSDIVRGASNPNETATAQQIKGQYASLRLGNMQKDVARFSCDIVRIMAEIIAEHFSIDTIKQISGVKLLTNMEKQQALMMAQQGQQPNEKFTEMMNKPSWEDVEVLLKDDKMRCFRVDIETDSTIKGDQEAEKKSRIEFIGAVGSFLQQAVAAPQDLQPLVMETLLFGIRGFKVGRELENTFKATIDKIKKTAEQPQQADPAQAKMQAEQQAGQLELQKMQFEAQAAQAQNQHDMQFTQMKAELDKQTSEVDLALKQADLELKKIDLEIKRLDVASKAANDIITA